MAGLSDVTAGMDLDQQSLAKILALRQGQGNASGGGRIWYDPSLKTDDPNGYIVHSYQGQRQEGGDGGSVIHDPSMDQNFITRLKPNTGGKVGDRWDLNGKYLGTVELNSGGGRDFNQAVALIAGGYLGGSAATGTGPFAGAGAGGAGGGLSAAGSTGTTTIGGLGEFSLADLAMGDALATGAGAGAGSVGGAGLSTIGTLGEFSVADMGMGTELAGGAGAGAGGTLSGGTGVGTMSTGLPSQSTIANTASKTLTAANGWEQLAKIGTGVIASTVAADTLSDPVDTSRYDELFTSLLDERALASQRGKDLWADYTNIFKPAQQKYVDTAMGYDTAGRREQAAQGASGLVASEYDQQRSTAQRELQMAGVDPSTIAMLGTSSRILEAKDSAGAQNAARDNVEKTGLALLRDVTGQGNTVVDQATRQSAVATGATQAASGILNSQATQQNNNTANRNALFGDLLTAGTTAYGMYTSSKKTKTVGAKVDGLAAARAVEKSPAKKWAYKKGQGDGSTKPRMGPMAEDLKREAPQVSNGKQVDGIAQLGLHHAAIGGLNKRLERIEKKLGGLADARRG